MKTRFVARRLQLVVALPRGASAPHQLLTALTRSGYINDTLTGRRFGGRTELTIILAQRDNMLPFTLLEQLARHLARHHGYLAAADPWDMGGCYPNVGFAIRVLGDVFRAAASKSSPQPTTPR